MRFLPVLLFSAAGAFAQTVSFDAATIKPVPPAGSGPIRIMQTGGPGTKDPGLYRCQNCTLSMLAMSAWDLRRFQITGPAALDADRFDITARVPAGATKEQFRTMLQNLLTERFKMAVHHETKEMPKYDLVVAKGGPKLKQSAPEDPSGDGPAPPPGPVLAPGGALKTDKDGYPILPAGNNGMTIMMAGRARTQGTAQTMEQLAAWLANQTGRPVTDATGLKGKFDYSLSWGMDMSAMRMPGGGGMPPPPPPPPGGGGNGLSAEAPDADAGPTLVSALQDQLGLKLEAKKGPVDVLVVDRVEKVPIEN